MRVPVARMPPQWAGLPRLPLVLLNVGDLPGA